jgi:transcriptional regulator with XRE-family HTH domain
MQQPPSLPLSFWATDQMRDALASWHMGRVIFAYRTHPHHGKALPQELVGSWLGLTQAQLSRIENGPAPEQLNKLIRWAEILGIPAGSLWFKLPKDVGEVGRAGTTCHNGESLLLLARLLSTDGFDSGSRGGSEQLQRITAALANSHRYFDGSTVRFFREKIEQCKADDGTLGPARALPLMNGILGAIHRHCKDVKPKVRRELLAVGAEGAEFAGWLYRDLHDEATAAFLYDRAMEWAQEANFLPMQNYVLMKKSQMAYDARDPGRVLTLAQAARNGQWRLPVKVSAEIMQQEALGLAIVGAPAKMVEQNLADAQQILAGSDDSENHDLGAYFDVNTLTLRSACCYTEAGEPRKAVGLFQNALASGTLSRRDMGLFESRQAKALALSGEPDEAATLALRAVTVARETRSERTMNVIMEVIRALEPWHGRPSARLLRESLTN